MKTKQVIIRELTDYEKSIFDACIVPGTEIRWDMGGIWLKVRGVKEKRKINFEIWNFLRPYFDEIEVPIWSSYYRYKLNRKIKKLVKKGSFNFLY